MTSLRTLSTSRLLALAGVVAGLCAAVAVLAVAASGSSGDTPPPKPLASAVHDSLTAPEVAGVTARVTFTNKLFPSGALLGSAGPVLMSGGSGRLWMDGGGKGRIELQSNAGDAQILWTPSEISIYDALSNTVYHATLPAKKAGSDGVDSQPTLAQVTDALTRLGWHAALPVVAPATLVGLPRRDVRLVGEGDSASVVVTYGQGLGAIVVVQRHAVKGSKSGGVTDNLPTVSLDGVSAHELATQLGTIVAWEQKGVSWTLAGSIPAAAAEAAARELK